MQIILRLRGENIVLPIAYRYFVQSMIYHTLESDPSFSYFMHEGGFNGDERNFKLFTFSPLKGNYRAENKKISFSGVVTLEIRSSVAEITDKLIKGFIGKKQFISEEMS